METSVSLKMPTSDPHGLIEVTMPFWMGKAVYFSRLLMNEIKDREDFDRPGVYILIGEDEKTGEQISYIGEGDTIKARLLRHYKDKDKDWWTHAVYFIAVDNTLHKTAIQYLESRMISEASLAQLSRDVQGNTPKLPTIDKYSQESMELFLDKIALTCKIISVNIFPQYQKKSLKHTKEKSEAKALELVTIVNGEAVATGHLVDGVMTVKAGSRAKVQETKSFPEHNRRLRTNLLSEGVLKQDGEWYLFTKDWVANSVSQATSLIKAASSSGFKDWVDKKDKKTSLGDLVSKIDGE